MILFLASLFGIIAIASALIIIDHRINGDDDYEEMRKFQRFQQAMKK